MRNDRLPVIPANHCNVQYGNLPMQLSTFYPIICACKITEHFFQWSYACDCWRLQVKRVLVYFQFFVNIGLGLPSWCPFLESGRHFHDVIILVAMALNMLLGVLEGLNVTSHWNIVPISSQLDHSHPLPMHLSSCLSPHHPPKMIFVFLFYPMCANVQRWWWLVHWQLYCGFPSSEKL